MAITDDELAEIRDHIGDDQPPTDAELSTSFDRLGSVPAVALSVVRRRLAALRNRAAEFTAEGDYSEKYVENIRALERQERSLAGAAAAAGTAESGTVTVGRMVRGRRR